jgi:hypothetical protein
MSPSETIQRDSLGSFAAVDKKGRRLLVRRLTALDTLKLFKAAGPVLSQNGSWLSMASLAFAVLEIDGVPIPAPTTEPQIESLVDKLGDDGLLAIAEVLNDDPSEAEGKAQVGNLPGTQS